MLLSSNNLRIFKIELICCKYSKKRRLVFLISYTFCFTFLLLYLKNTLVLNQPEDCTLQSIDAIEEERNSILNSDASFTKLLKDVTDDKPALSQWIAAASNIYVYSAFLEPCPPQLSSQFCVKFISIVLVNSSSSESPILRNVSCAVKGNFEIHKGESVTVELLPEDHDKSFTTAFLFCPVKKMHITHATIYENNSFNFTWCSVQNDSLLLTAKLNSTTKSNRNLISLNSPQGIALCVRPLYNNFSITSIIEFLIYYSVMGVDHFLFYYHKSFKPLKTFLKTLKFSNISNDVFLWDIPLNNDLIHEFGQMAFTQDCLARSKNKFKHAIIVDLDEYIVPKAHKDLKSLLSYLDETNPLAGSYVIQMALFCYEYSVTNTHISPFRILNHNKRQGTPWLHHYRSKYIARPERVRSGGIHYTWELESNFKEVFVSPNIALLNHYRYCCGMSQTWFFHWLEFKVLNDNAVVDDTLVIHKEKFTNNNLFKSLV